MTKKNILLIDDDEVLAELLGEYLTSKGFAFHYCANGVRGLEKAYDDSIDLILLDVMMPGLTGFEVLKALGGHHKTPILMLTARGDDNDRVLGLELGADDYLAKPFHHQELLARINAIIRRIEIVKNLSSKHPIKKINEVTLNHATRIVMCHDNNIELTGTEFQILDFLMSKANEIVSKNTISEQVLNKKLTTFDRNIDMHISNVRRKLLAFSPKDKLKTVRGAGYIFLSGEGS